MRLPVSSVSGEGKRHWLRQTQGDGERGAGFAWIIYLGRSPRCVTFAFTFTLIGFNSKIVYLCFVLQRNVFVVRGRWPLDVQSILFAQWLLRFQG